MGKPYVAFLWHHHQPPYFEPAAGDGVLALPWVRLHAARDYYQMGALAARFPGLRLTFNFTPALLAQFDAYLERGARDRLQELSLRDFGGLTAAEEDLLIASSFDADFRNQIKDHPRYFKLYRKFCRREAFSRDELTDAVALFNLAWTAEIFREEPVALETGVRLELAELFRRGGGYRPADVEAIIAAQLEIMRAVVPLHAALAAEGRIEICTTPFYHPILPLLHDTDDAIIDRPGSRHPRRFARPADAREQVVRALAFFERRFGFRPAGMWPAEGAVGQEAVAYFEEAGVKWVATDEGVLAASRREDGAPFDPRHADVLFRPYRVGAGNLAAFFRHRGLSDAVGFVYQHWRDPAGAAADFAKQLRSLLELAFARSFGDAVVTVILDGENAWGAYRRHGVPFLTELYGILARGEPARCVTFAEYLEGTPARDLAPHPPATLERVGELACASWIDEAGSLPGNDLGTWAGEPEENRAWDFLGAAREALASSEAVPRLRERAYDFILRAEASDWFWWYGDDQGGGADETFDRLFRANLRAMYDLLGEPAPPALDAPIAPRRVVWRPDLPVHLRPGDLLVVEWGEPGEIRFGVNGWQNPRQVPLAPTHGVMGRRDGVFRAPLLRVTADVRRVELTFADLRGRWLGYDFFIPVA